MSMENSLPRDSNKSSLLFSSYPSIVLMQCEILLPFFLNRTVFLNNQQSTPPYLRGLLAKHNLTLRSPKNLEECVLELNRLLNNTNESNLSNKKSQQIYGLQERSRSLIIFVVLIALVSMVSILGNLCLAKVLYTKRFRLSQTDRIVLCLAISELCLVLIDSPIEIYRFLSFTFSITWLCRFHTFFESFFSSCIIFYHLLGAFDRFVYIHGHTSSNASTWSKWCRRIATKSGSYILLILPMLCSLPIAICNLFHAHVLHTSSDMNICVVQYTHGILLSFLISFYILPLVFSFFLHAKLIYFIRSKHTQQYLAATTPQILLLKRNNTFDSQMIGERRQLMLNHKTPLSHQKLKQSTTMNNKTGNKRVVMFNTDTIGNTAGTFTSTITAGQKAGPNHSSHSSASSRSSNGTSYTSLTSPIIRYKINSQANANAKRTVLLLVLLLSFYVLCWAPYNIYTWRHAYQLVTTEQTENMFNRTLVFDFNVTITSLTDNLHASLRRIIFTNYSLYLLSMISMCFSFIFYFSLNKHARQEFAHTIGCICPQLIDTPKEEPQGKKPKEEYEPTRRLQYHMRCQHQYPSNNQFILAAQNSNRRVRTMRYNTHPMIVPPTLTRADRQNDQKRTNSLESKLDSASSKRIVLTYGCRVRCCP